ncbi:hypothetical protein [sulfur-oxidizing endosymbiont of Gigantopelta aegis]|uniref:hypothetical protein n=1 Tax=sulfur-oxidizing endosymbiont of Gigantopelta aegis TaxID=2794934 RepID=UPI0018DB073C|nr:hypothetical protein [sulfur-oxidizing endosymbiont of Gigantopelta aegis]
MAEKAPMTKFPENQTLGAKKRPASSNFNFTGREDIIMDSKIAEELKQFEEHLDDITCLECGYEGTVGIISEEPTFHFWKYFLSTASFVFSIFVIGLFVDNESMILYPLLSIDLSSKYYPYPIYVW